MVTYKTPDLCHTSVQISTSKDFICVTCLYKYQHQRTLSVLHICININIKGLYPCYTSVQISTSNDFICVTHLYKYQTKRSYPCYTSLQISTSKDFISVTHVHLYKYQHQRTLSMLHVCTNINIKGLYPCYMSVQISN